MIEGQAAAGGTILTSKTAVAATPATKVGMALLTTAKAGVLSPIFGIAVLGGIIAFELWRGAKDAQGFALAEKADS